MNFHGVTRIKNPKTLQNWIDRGWYKEQIESGFIFAVGCGRFKSEVCICSKCRNVGPNNTLQKVLKINSY